MKQSAAEIEKLRKQLGATQSRSADSASLKADDALKKAQKAAEEANSFRDKAIASLKLETKNYETASAENVDLQLRLQSLETNFSVHADTLRDTQASLQHTKSFRLRQIIFSAFVAVTRTSTSEFHLCCAAFRHRILCCIILQSLP